MRRSGGRFRLALATPRQRLGRRGERIAARFLRRNGYSILDRNAFVGPGEADLICLGPDRRSVVIVEVKTRRPGPGPGPEAGLRESKRRALRTVRTILVRANGWENRPVRIDLVTVVVLRKGKAEVRQYEGVV